jgi:hypothetical protein
VITNLSADIKMEADERLRAFLQAWKYEQHGQLPQEAHDQRMAIDSLHAELIHMQEEKVLFAQQVRSLLCKPAHFALECSSVGLTSHPSADRLTTSGRHQQQQCNFHASMVQTP